MCLFIFAISGDLEVGGHRVPQRDALGVWDTGTVPINCVTEAEFLVIETPVNQK